MTISYARYDATNAYHRNISRNNNNNCDLCRNTVFLAKKNSNIVIYII